MVDLAGRRIVIFGGGDVAARKAVFFCREASVQLISRSFVPSIRTLPVELVEADLEGMPDNEVRRFLDGTFLAVAATSDPAINNRIGEICTRAGVLFNNASGRQGDVLIPSVVRGDSYLLAISTLGDAPGVPRLLREFIESRCPQLDGMITLQKRLRERLKETEPSLEKRQEILRSVLHDRELWGALEISPEHAWEQAEGRHLHG